MYPRASLNALWRLVVRERGMSALPFPQKIFCRLTLDFFKVILFIVDNVIEK